MNELKVYVEEILEIRKQPNNHYYVDVSYDCYGVISKTTLYAKDEKELSLIKKGLILTV